MKRGEKILLITALALAAVVGLRPSIRGNDGVGHYVYLASLLGDGDLDFADDYAQFDRIYHYSYMRFAQLPTDPRTGRASNRYGIGAALLWAPFVGVTHIGLKITNPAMADGIGGQRAAGIGQVGEASVDSDQGHGIGHKAGPYEWAVGIATVIWSSLGLGLLYARLRRNWSPLAAGLTLAGLVGATPLGFYLYAHGSMSHGVSFFAMTAALLALERAWRRPGPKSMAICGLFTGLAFITRFQDASWALVIGLALAWRIWAIKKQAIFWLLNLGAFAAGALIMLLPQMAVWNYLYGSWLSGPAPYLNRSAGEFSLWPRHMIEALVSERGGALAWHPLLAVGLAGLGVLAMRGECRNRLQKGYANTKAFDSDSDSDTDTDYDSDSDTDSDTDTDYEHESCLRLRSTPAQDMKGEKSDYDYDYDHDHEHEKQKLLDVGRGTLRAMAWVGLVGFAMQAWLIGCWSMWWGGASFGNRFFISSLPFLALGVAGLTDLVSKWGGRKGRVLLTIILAILILWNLGLLVQYATEMVPREAVVPWSRVIRQNFVDVPRWVWERLR